jgi:hypothetical protein
MGRQDRHNFTMQRKRYGVGEDSTHTARPIASLLPLDNQRSGSTYALVTSVTSHSQIKLVGLNTPPAGIIGGDLLDWTSLYRLRRDNSPRSPYYRASLRDLKMWWWSYISYTRVAVMACGSKLAASPQQLPNVVQHRHGHPS